jgi:glutamyl-tRNA synthetase
MISNSLLSSIISLNRCKYYSLIGFHNIQKCFLNTNIKDNNNINNDNNNFDILKPVRVRFAPSPTGTLHIGGARTALFNWLIAKKTNGKFIIRIEDTDEGRSTKESEISILNDLKYLKMDWDEGPDNDEGPYYPYRQSDRVDIYKKYAEKLINEDKAYKCFCTEEELQQKRKIEESKGFGYKYDGKWRDSCKKEVQKRIDNGESYTVRFKVPQKEIMSVNDIVRGTVSWDVETSLGDFIILRSNGIPVYNFCVAIDDALMKISHVLRAEEHLPNTLRQVLILKALNYKPPIYAHCSLILGEDKLKLSKRNGAMSIKQFKELGFIPDAMINYLANLGFNDGTNQEIYTIAQLIESFNLNRIIKHAAVFDMNKLTWINAQHLKLLHIDEIKQLILPIISGEGNLINNKVEFENKELFNKFLLIASKISQRDMHLINESKKLINDCLEYNIKNTLVNDNIAKEIIFNKNIIKVLIEDYNLSIMPKGNEDNFNEIWKIYMKNISKKLNLKGKALFHPVRLFLTGRMSGPDVGDQIQLLHYVENLTKLGIILPSASISIGNRLFILKNYLNSN